MREVAVLTAEEVDILRRAQEDPNVFTEYFFRPIGEAKGWTFDENFTEEAKWQKQVHLAEQADITVIGGFGTGKTLGVGMSACVWACTSSDFKFLNVAQKQWQAKQMYDLILLHARNARFDDLIWERPRRPHNKIVIKFKIGKQVFESSLEFMSVDRDGTGILSWEGDWINVDEAGLLDNLDEIITHTGSRMRGTVRGRERLGRFSMTSNSWDNFHLWYYFDNAVADPANYLSLQIQTQGNRNVTSRQYERMLQRIPESDRQRFLDAGRPEGKGVFFQRAAIEACEDHLIGEIVKKNAEAGMRGYTYGWVRGANVIHFRIPAKNGHLYMLIGDPGTDAPPRRNAYVWGVFDVTHFPQKPAQLVAFVWGGGGGRIQPFIDMGFDLADVYRPIKIWIDSTGPQKNTAQLINEHLFAERFGGQVGDELEGDLGQPLRAPGFDTPIGRTLGLGGLDFAGNGKMTYLQALRLFIENGMLVWPFAVSGIRAQLSNYDPEKDKKIAQDIVAMMAMASHAIRGFFHVDAETLAANSRQRKYSDTPVARRRSPAGRSRRSPRAHAPASQYYEESRLS